MSDGSGLWDEAAHKFPVEGLDRFLLWAADRDCSDVTFQTGAPAFVEIDGDLRRATAAVLDGVTMEALTERVFHSSGVDILRSGRAIDCSHAVMAGRREFRRFRCNILGVLAEQRFGINISMRVLPDYPPTLEELGIESEIVEAWEECRGLTLVTGIPGSGKSTLLAAGTRRLLERGAGRVQSYERPIEFVFDAVEANGALMSSSEVPRDIAGFAEGVRASLRRRPAAVIVGEARDRETVEAVVDASDFGIAVYSTTHTNGVAATVRRLLAEFAPEERLERGVALLDALNLVVTQVLVRNPKGGRSAVREWLTFDASLKADLMERSLETWPARLAVVVADTGNDLGAGASRAYREGRIDGVDLRRILAASRPGAVTGPGMAEVS